jgi:putative spermidine/putrescine transport system permease protein
MVLSERIGRAALSASCWLVIVYLMLPLGIIIGVSFTATPYLRFPPEGFTFAWYWKFLTDTSYLQSIELSASLSVSATAVALLLGVPTALVLSRAEIPGRRTLAGLFLSPLILPPIVIGAALLQYASALGFARTYLALLIGHTVLVIPYIVRTALAALSGSDRSFEEAAQDLGASRVGAFFLVTLPIIKPGLIAGALFAVIISWINVELSIFNSTASLLPIPVKLFNYIQYSVDPMIAAVSATTIYVAIVVVVALDFIVGIDKVTTSSR